MNAELIERSLELAAERCEDLTPLVYARLFADHPQMEAMFWGDTNWAIRGEMLSKVFSAILDFIGERLYAHTLIQTEVVNHAGYDVPPDVFRVFFGTVAATVREVIGADWTPDIDQAWTDLLAQLDFYVTHPNQAETQGAPVPA
ncbi:globin domain-containing protein [Phenylobacterium sp.]|uniref:globin domain-containing protein n=1 Tax=Phenylobacterium sp. TaxID=1871053 RepID=UPI003BAD3891